MHETLLERPKARHERQIDEIARRYHDTVTEAAEALDGVMYTEIPLGYDGEDIYSLNDGTSFGAMMRNSLEAAETIAEENPTLAFELDRRRLEADELPLMIEMAQGGFNTMVVVSDFPAELDDATEDIGGYNVSRKQAMLRVITRLADGSISLETQSLDGSDRRGLEAIYKKFGVAPEPGGLLGQRILCELDPYIQVTLTQELTTVYDAELGRQYGGVYYAGREHSRHANTADFVRLHDDLLQSYIRSPLYDDPAYKYGFFQLLKEAYEQPDIPRVQFASVISPTGFDINIHHEIREAARRGVQQGSVFSACGGTLRGGEANGPLSDYEAAGYGNAAGDILTATDKYGSLDFSCPNGHKNTRPRNKLVECCKVCGVSVRC